MSWNPDQASPSLLFPTNSNKAFWRGIFLPSEPSIASCTITSTSTLTSWSQSGCKVKKNKNIIKRVNQLEQQLMKNYLCRVSILLRSGSSRTLKAINRKIRVLQNIAEMMMIWNWEINWCLNLDLHSSYIRRRILMLRKCIIFSNYISAVHN